MVVMREIALEPMRVPEHADPRASREMGQPAFYEGSLLPGTKEVSHVTEYNTRDMDKTGEFRSYKDALASSYSSEKRQWFFGLTNPGHRFVNIMESIPDPRSGQEGKRR
ncbi:hypothetical protein BBK36DRAFT_1142262 [Trichoderma citrinoviride]|uniref:Uncharacterized protein n=1 Tax=Trichoderma citrinoviride TaxID=58853 RepID=A0A2T4B7G6_9HYPO|nr:hypothetical protein BBK36DRAFT_1142262 [Trichoderma citrinoviride]PTB65272.1 hypothetical protein BBK36DRAFT_1142262 [Trichoderma citrinoviride]